MFQENDVVKLKRAITPDEPNIWPGTTPQFLPQGLRGAVVMVYGALDATTYEVEFVLPDGATHALLTLTDRDLEAG